jgi:hypothetical protein
MTTPKQPADRKKPKPKPRPKPENGPKPAPEVPVNKTVTFKGREIEVKKPTPEQLYAWERLLKKLEVLAKEAATVDQARTLLDRCYKIINSVVAKEDDRLFLEDGALDGTVTIEESASIVLDALKVYEDELTPEPANRAARRAKD